jgi:hypothetical protein
MFNAIARRLYPPVTPELMAERDLHEARMGVLLHASLAEQCEVDAQRLADDAIHHQRLTRMYEDRIERLTDKHAGSVTPINKSSRA